MRPALPRHRRTAACATRSSVPFSCACVKSSVTPASVRNNWTGKPARTSLRLMPPRRRRPSTPTPARGRRRSARVTQLTIDGDDEGTKGEPGEVHGVEGILAGRVAAEVRLRTWACDRGAEQSTAAATAAADARPHAREVVDLMAARRAGGDDDRVAAAAAHGGEEPPFADGARHLVVFPVVAERTGHAAAAGVEIHDRRPRHARQERSWPARPGPSTSGGSGRAAGSAPGRCGVAAPIRRAARNSSKQHARAGDRDGTFPRFAPQQRRRILADRRQAARLAEHDRPAGGGVRVERVGVAPRPARAASSRPFEICGRPQQPLPGQRCGAMPAAARTSSAARPISGS